MPYHTARLGLWLRLTCCRFTPLPLMIRANIFPYDDLQLTDIENDLKAIAEAGLLAAHRQQSAFDGDTDFIFCRKDGRPPNHSALRNHLAKAMKAVGIIQIKGQHGFHIFRHSAGTLIYSKSRDLKLVQGTLGHADISTTSDIYVHLDDRIIAEGTEILAAEILGNCDPGKPDGQLSSLQTLALQNQPLLRM